MKRYPDFLRPSLVRRVISALLIAFGLVWVVLLAHQFYSDTDQDSIDKNLRALGENMLATVAGIDNSGEARAVVAATSTLINNSYRMNQVPGVLLMQLSDARGQRLYLSPEGGAATLAGDARALRDASALGRTFRVYRGDSARWSLLVAVPHLSPSWVLLKMSAGLTSDMLIAFPFVLLPLWLSVARGLRPLRRLSEQIAARGADDLAPLAVDTSYAELTPLTTALDRLLAQLRGKVAREHAFVQDAAHELRTPLAVISAQAHVLVGASGREQRVDAERRLDLAIARASHLIQQLLDLAHIDASQAEAAAGTARELDVAQLLRHELALAAPAAMARELELSLEAPDALAHALEAHAFVSILQNLIGNALRYVQDGGQVAVALSRELGVLRLSVADNGPGIPQAQRSLVFERFYRGGDHDAPGSGLGLAIVTQAVARLRGTVKLTDGLHGRGCTFVVEIPAASGAITGM